MRHRLLTLFLLAAAARAATPVSGYKVINKYPHSTQNFTEGFFYLDGHFYEGTGLKGSSAIIVTEPQTGKQLQRLEISPEFFGEGIINFGPNLYEWTWETHTGFIYDRATLRRIKEFTYTGEGWGMTRTATQIITSDGSPILRFRDPATFNEVRHITVKDGAQPVERLNELEYIDGEIYANVWHTDRIARISPADGRVIGWIDLTGILPDYEMINEESVLNGIAWDPEHRRLFVTGKQWPWIFEITVSNRKKP